MSDTLPAHLCCRTCAKPCMNSWVPSPVLRLARQMCRFGTLPIVKERAFNGSRSTLFSKIRVLSVTREANDAGSCSSEPAAFDGTSTSGAGSTHSETSDEFTLSDSVSYVVGVGGMQYAHNCLARSTPIFSTRSSVLRSPAVSATITGKPPMSSESSRISRVVPGTGVTIAASRCATMHMLSSTSGYLWQAVYAYPGSSTGYSFPHLGARRLLGEYQNA